MQILLKLTIASGKYIDSLGKFFVLCTHGITPVKCLCYGPRLIILPLEEVQGIR